MKWWRWPDVEEVFIIMILMIETSTRLIDLKLEDLWYWVSNDLNWSLVTDSLKPCWSWWRGVLLCLRNSEQGIQYAKLLQFTFDWMRWGPTNLSITINHRMLITGNRYFVILRMTRTWECWESNMEMLQTQIVIDTRRNYDDFNGLYLFPLPSAPSDASQNATMQRIQLLVFYWFSLFLIGWLWLPLVMTVADCMQKKFPVCLFKIPVHAIKP